MSNAYGIANRECFIAQSVRSFLDGFLKRRTAIHHGQQRVFGNANLKITRRRFIQNDVAAVLALFLEIEVQVATEF